MCIMADSLVINTTKSHKDSPIVEKVKKEMLNTAINLSFVDFGTFLFTIRTQ